MAAARSAAPARPASRRGLQENRLRLLHRLDLEQPLAQLGRARHSLRVPTEMLAELERRAAGVALEPKREARVLQGHREPLRRGRGSPPGAARPKNPRPAEGPRGSQPTPA